MTGDVESGHSLTVAVTLLYLVASFSWLRLHALIGSVPVIDSLEAHRACARMTAVFANWPVRGVTTTSHLCHLPCPKPSFAT